MQKIENNPSLIRDEKSKAIINVDSLNYRLYREQRAAIQARVNITSAKVTALENKINILEDLIKNYLENNNGNISSSDKH